MSKPTTKKFSHRSVALMKEEIAHMAERVVQLGREGASSKMLCRELDISSAELAELRERSTMFDAAYQKALDLSQGFHEAQLLAGVSDKNMNSQLYANFMRAAFPQSFESATYKVAEKKESKSAETGMTHADYQREVNDLLIALRKAGE